MPISEWGLSNQMSMGDYIPGDDSPIVYLQPVQTRVGHDDDQLH